MAKVVRIREGLGQVAKWTTGVGPLHSIPSVPSDPDQFRALPNPPVEAFEAAFASVSALLCVWPSS